MLIMCYPLQLWDWLLGCTESKANAQHTFEFALQQFTFTFGFLLHWFAQAGCIHWICYMPPVHLELPWALDS